jgi:hypothetical protein
MLLFKLRVVFLYVVLSVVMLSIVGCKIMLQCGKLVGLSLYATSTFLRKRSDKRASLIHCALNFFKHKAGVTVSLTVFLATRGDTR